MKKRHRHSRRHKKIKLKNKSHNDRMFTFASGIMIIIGIVLAYYLPQNEQLTGKVTSELPNGAERLMEGDYVIGRNDEVGIVNVRAYSGPDRQDTMDKSDYRFEVYGRNNELLQQVYFPAYFVVFDPFQEVDEIPVTIALPYREQYAIVDIVHNNSIIFRHDVTALCRQDGLCQGRENTVSCPADCLTGSADNYCDRRSDNICDPDCLAGDEDCSSSRAGWLFTAIGVAVVLAVVTLFLKRRQTQ